MTQKCKNVKKRFLTQLTLTLMISLFYFGCGGSQGLHSIDQLPKWAQHPPVNCGLGAINYQGNIGLPKSGAIARGRDALARQLKTKVEGLMKDYQRQGDEGGVTFSESQITQVSEQTVKEMAQGVCSKSGAQLAVTVSGIAGPGGGSDEKPVGTVWFGFVCGDSSAQIKQVFNGDRDQVRCAAISFAITHLIKMLSEK